MQGRHGRADDLSLIFFIILLLHFFLVSDTLGKILDGGSYK